ncbi:hypothetical protein [Lacticaseibacillus parakribbianus]|uniref:hypothetical protein n=1 Tax=Lacticaseibacillus parakribbianus TaxID=2970927 RepID=UPI0021CB651D|nr:hypothetical protein [Lacticaseibacillus parakribbianus]
MFELWWWRLRRSRLLWMLAAGAVVFGSGVAGVSYWRKGQEDQALVARLNRQVESLAQEVQQAPARPQKLQTAEKPYWQALAIKKQLVTAQHHAALALAAKDYRRFTDDYAVALTTTLELEKVQPDSGLAFAQMTLPALNARRHKALQIAASKQTLIWSIWSLAPRALAQRCLAFLMWLPVLVFVTFGCGTLWRELFDTPNWRFQLLNTRRGWQLQVVDLGFTVVLLLGFTVVAVGIATLWGCALGGAEQVGWRYPLSNTSTLGHQWLTQLSYWLPCTVMVVSWYQFGTLVVRQLSGRLALLLLVAIGLGFIPGSANPFAQLQCRALTAEQTDGWWPAAVLVLVALVAVAAVARQLRVTSHGGG